MKQAGHILVVDRDRRVHDAITTVLRQHGWSCVALADARQAAEALRRDIPDVLIVDLGVAAYRKLLRRRVGKPVSLPVIIGMGRRSMAAAVAALDFGAVAFVPKPLRPRHLVPRVTAALEKAQAVRSLMRAERMLSVWSEWLRLVDAVLSMPGSANVPLGGLGGTTARGNSPRSSNKAGEWSTPARSLSLREREALFGLTSGLRPRQIARALGVTIHTARAHLKAVMKKLNVHSQGELLDRVRQPWLTEEQIVAGHEAVGSLRRQ